MKKLRKVLSVVLTLCLLATFTPVLAAESNGAPATTAAPEVSHTLMAGAGAADINFSPEVLKAAQDGREGFNGEVHDVPHARVLLLEDETKVAVVALELVQITEIIDDMHKLVSDLTGVPYANVWIHVTHAITTPHASQGEYADTVAAALTEACEEAMDSLQPASMGVGKVDGVDVNANRNFEWPEGEEGPFYAPNPDNPESNKTMTILRFDSVASGEPIGFFLSYGIKPTAIDNSWQTEQQRVVSTDVPGVACTMVEEEFGAPCLFFMPAAGDQVPKEMALYDGEKADGTFGRIDAGVPAGLEIVERLGAEMGDAAVKLAGDIKCDTTDADIKAAAAAFTAHGFDKRNNSEEITQVNVSGITIGDVALVGFAPELDCKTELDIWANSPYDTTLLVSFLNEDGKYMPHAEAYDANGGKGTFEVSRANFDKGTAETFAEKAVSLLTDMKAGTDMISSNDAIVGVSTIGFVDTDGAKVKTIVVEYSVDLTGAEISPDAYTVTNRGTDNTPEVLGEGARPGQPVAVRVEGNKVYIDVDTDYQNNRVAQYDQAMYASVLQTSDIVTPTLTITAGSKAAVNYTEVASSGGPGGGGPGGGGPGGDQGGQQGGQGGPGGGGPGGGGSSTQKVAAPGTYQLTDVEQFQLYGETAYGIQTAGPAFHAPHCWEEATGEYVDVDLPYALYVPENYDPSQEYALVLQIEDAGALSTDPVVGITESQGAVNFASEAAQKLVQEKHDLAGVIVVVPEICEELRSTRDNYSMSAAVPATWQLLDYITENYSISMSHIYATGQSMGGMQVVAMAAQRDNYFAGIWANGCQWGANHNLEAPYADRNGEMICYETPVDGVYVTGTDFEGNPVDYRNWYYMISDDNILITNCQGDSFSSTVWKELRYLYLDTAGVTIPTAIWDPTTLSDAEQEAQASALLTGPADIGFYWTAFNGGDHMATWIYSHGVWAHTEWLLSQEQSVENERGKLENLLNDYAVEEDQSAAAADADRAYTGGYFKQAKAGAGTADYNSGLFSMQGQINQEGREPGWTYDPNAPVPSEPEPSNPEPSNPEPSNPEPSEPEPGTPAAQTYTVKAGDCLWNIALKFYGTGTKWNVIYEANKSIIKDPTMIYIGQVLTIPAK